MIAPFRGPNAIVKNISESLISKGMIESNRHSKPSENFAARPPSRRNEATIDTATKSQIATNVVMPARCYPWDKEAQ
jgi:hypothetical protein